MTSFDVLTVFVIRMRSNPQQASPAAPSCVSKAWAMAEMKSSLSRRSALRMFVADKPLPMCLSLISRNVSSIVKRRAYRYTISAAPRSARLVAMHHDSFMPF